MKKNFWLIFGFCFLFGVFGFVDKVQTKASYDYQTIYYNPTVKDSTAVDANDLLTDYKHPVSYLTTIRIDPTGTDTSFGFKLWIDPREQGSTQVKKLYLIGYWSGLSCVTPDDYKYVIPSVDVSANGFGGFITEYGDLYGAVVDTTSTDTTDIKIWITTD